MTIEEKAKAYDESLERAKNVLNCRVTDREPGTNICEYIFPELQESEDERIRKGIMSILKHYKENGEYVCPYPFVSIDESISWLENQGKQKPADKVKPKFKTGNWYKCTKDFFGKGVTFDKNTAYYCAKEGCLQNEYGCHVAIVKDLYDNFKLWTLEDANDGDVLSDGTTIFIFKDLLSDSSVMSYCDYDTGTSESDAFCPLSVNLVCSKIHPATKEQRDTLIKAMTDVGYTFDFEKKELKKIEQKSIEWHREDEQNLNACLGYIPDEFLRRWLTDIIHVKYDKLAWNEEDERTYKSVLYAFEHNYPLNNEQQKFIKSLKDIVLPQPQQKWSEEDEDAISMAIIALEDMYDEDSPDTTYGGYNLPFNKAAERLKSIKKRMKEG